MDFKKSRASSCAKNLMVMLKNPVERFKEFARAVENNVVKLYPSTKHIISRDFGKFETLPSLKHRCEA
jgi:hypothetical protein